MKHWLVALVLAWAGATSAQAPAASASGEITKIDKAAAKVTIRHGEIKALDMPPMTMVYRVREPRLLEGVAVGDRVQFTAAKIEGNYTVTALSRAR